MLLVAAFLLSAVLSFALSLTIAALVGPGPFGRYGIAVSLALVLTTALFEWLRLSTTRFYSERTRVGDPAIRSTLDLLYLAVALALACVTGLVSLPVGTLAMPTGFSPALLAAAVAAAIGTGFSDYRMALARCRFLDRPYAGVVIGRGAAMFVLMAGTAWFVGEPTAILFAWAVAGMGAALAATRPLADARSPGRQARRELIGRFCRYAIPLVAASAVYQVIPFANRAILASRAGYVEVGYFSLASEIAARLFQNLGAALDVALFQIAIRAQEEHGPDAAERQVERNLAITVAIVVPAAAGLAAVWPSFEGLFAPLAFRGNLDSTAQAVIPAFALFALAQYAMNPLFQIRHRTGIVVAAALVALALDVGGLLLWPNLVEPAEVARVQAGALAVALAVLLVLAVASGVRLPWRAIGVTLGSAALMSATLWPWRSALPAAAELPLQVAAGALVYGGLALAFDLCGVRAAFLQRVALARKR